jgi:hypothetical protein
MGMEMGIGLGISGVSGALNEAISVMISSVLCLISLQRLLRALRLRKQYWALLSLYQIIQNIELCVLFLPYGAVRSITESGA